MNAAISKPTILAVDDCRENIEILGAILKQDYHVQVALSGDKALRLVEQSRPDLILLDVVMPEMSGYEVCEQLKTMPHTRHIPVIFVTARDEAHDEARGFAVGAVDYLAKPVNRHVALARIKTHLALSQQCLLLEQKVKERTKELAETQAATIFSLATLAEYRDNETGGHIIRTQTYIRVLAEKLRRHPRFQGILDNDDTIDLLYQSAPLHDIGKVGVPDNILLKPGKLTAEEFTIMKKHTIYGYEAILRAEKRLGADLHTSFLRFAREIAYTHQEKWDGSGYPRGLQGEAIPVSGRLMAIADVYDAMISKRVYKPPIPHDKVVVLIEKSKGTHFDADMTEAFLDIKEEFRRIALEYADYDEERAALS